MDTPPGHGCRLRRTLAGRGVPLVAVDPSGRWVAGGCSFDLDTGETGGWLAPGFCGRGLGMALFAGAAEFAHHHLGVASVIAGTEVTNTACLGALTAAGFIPVPGPVTHALPNGRVIASRWFRHHSPRPAYC